jgi:hypothetical protein
VSLPDVHVRPARQRRERDDVEHHRDDEHLVEQRRRGRGRDVQLEHDDLFVQHRHDAVRVHGLLGSDVRGDILMRAERACGVDGVLRAL